MTVTPANSERPFAGRAGAGPTLLARRTLMVGTVTVPLWGTPVLGAPVPDAPEIRPRSAWAEGLKPQGDLWAESEVRFLLIHHTATTNDYDSDEVPRQLRTVFGFHTSEERGWADVAYNFFVDRFGTVWEGRQGSIASPVRADATGGSQGYAQLCCFLGDFSDQAPSKAALDAMARLLAWLSVRDGLDLAAEVTFISRGSSRWVKGKQVTTATVAGHRDMSVTACPGDALYPLIRSQLVPRARELLVPSPTPTASPTPARSPRPPSPAAVSIPPASTVTAPVRPDSPAGPGVAVPDWAPAGVVGAAAGLTAAWALLRRRRRSDKQRHDDDDGTHGKAGQEADEETSQGE